MPEEKARVGQFFRGLREKYAVQEESPVSVPVIRKTIPSPTSGAVGPGSHASTLVRSMGQRLFEKVLQGEGHEGSLGRSGVPEEMSLLTGASQEMTGVRERSTVRNADPEALQAMISAAYIKASALGSGASPWKGSSVLGASLHSGILAAPAGGSGLDAVSSEGSGFGTAVSPEDGLGRLAARFESGAAGVEAIGYDPAGGTSYGMYQIASRTGTMSLFLDFLEMHEPRWAARLRAAGPANTGSTGGAMPKVWRSLAKENPERFAALQQAFIRLTHYEPARQAVEKTTGVDVDRTSRALQEVLWSTAVQHGPGRAAEMFIRAVKEQSRVGGALNEAALIRSIYKNRSRSTQGLEGPLREALLRRFWEEQGMALAMLHEVGKDPVA